MLRYLVEGLLAGLVQVTPAKWDLETAFYLIVGPAWLFLLASALTMEGAPWQRSWLGWLHVPQRAYWLLLAGLMIITRSPLMVAREMNPDESLLLAAAQIIKNGGAFYVNADAETSAPLNALVLLAGPVFGLPLDYAWLRLYASLVWLGVVLIMAYALRGWVPDWIRRSGALVCALLPSSFQQGALGHSAGELMPTLMIALSFLILLRAARGEARELHWPIVAGVVWGLSPFTKPQGPPVEAAIGLLMAMTIWRREPRRRLWLGTWVISTAVTVGVVVGLIWWVGGWREFIYSFLLRNFEWVDVLPRGIGFYLTWGWEESFVQSDTRVFYWLLSGLLVVGAWMWRGASTTAKWTLAGAMLILMSSIYAAGRPGTAFPHHALMLTGASFFLVWMLLHEISERRPWLAGLWCLLAVMIMLGNRAIAGTHVVLNRHEDQPQVQDIQLGSQVFRYADRGEALGIWGWTPRLHVELGMPAATQFITTAMQFHTHPPLRDYFVDRYRADMQAARPAVLMDTSGSSIFPFRDTYRLGCVDGRMQLWVEEHYVRLPEVDGSTVWVRKDRYEERRPR